MVCGQAKAVELLLSYNADPNILNKTGETALHQAVESDQFEIVKLLLQYNTDPCIQREDGESPLNIAIKKSSETMIELLSNYKNDPLISKLSCFDKEKNSLFSNLEASEINSKNMIQNDFQSIIEPEIEDSTKNSLYQWLIKMNLQELFEVFVNQGYDDLNFLLEQMKTEPLTLEVLKEIGVNKIGHRLIVLACLEDEINKFLRKSAPIASNCCSKKTAEELSSLKQWLVELNLQNYHFLFIKAGFFDLEKMFFVMNSSYPITEEILKDIGIEKIGHRQRILIKLREEAKNRRKTHSFVCENDAKAIACGTCKII